MSRYLRDDTLAVLVAAREPGPSITTATIVGRELICVKSDRTAMVWDLDTHEVAAADAKLLTSLRPLGLAAQGDRIWVFDGQAIEVLRHHGVIGRLKVTAPDSSRFVHLAKTRDGPFLVFRDGIVNAVTGERFPVPVLRGQGTMKLSVLSPLCLADGDRTVWVGTGYGEWGGHLVGFDTDTKRWVSYYDASTM